jgi:hypothetical protein
MMSAPAPLLALDWPSLSRKARTLDWAGAVVEALEESFRTQQAVLPSAPPLEQSEWIHYYFCDACASRLAFDPVKPREHRCPECGKEYPDPKRDGAWRTLLHKAIMDNVEAAAVLARLQPGRRDCVDFIRGTFLFYAAHYRAYPVHGVHAGKGRVMPQSLDEAVWIIQAARCLRWGRGQDWFSPGESALIREQFFRPAAELLQPQILKIHNIHVWLNSAVAACAFWLEDSSLLGWTIDGEFGWKRQMDEGLRADGFWWENSIGYHFYSFQAFASLALTADEAGRSLWNHGGFLQMLKAPLDLAFADGTLPAHNDTWKKSLLDFAGMYELGAGAWPEAGLEAALARLYREAEKRSGTSGPARRSLEALLYGPATLPVGEAPAPASRHFEASGIGILENDRVRVCLKAGPHGGGHDHCDKLNVDVLAANGWKSEDLGTSGYGAEITNRWYKQPAAHNIPVVNQEKQAAADGVMLQFGPDRMGGEVTGAYPGVSLRRSIELEPSGWKDATWIEGSEPAELDWCFHGSGRLETALPLEPAQTAGTQSGFDWLKDVRAGATDEDWEVAWKDGPRTVRLRFKGAPGTRVLLAAGDGNPAQEKLGVVIVRRRAASTCFEGHFEIL